jgi:hypothetical protein
MNIGETFRDLGKGIQRGAEDARRRAKEAYEDQAVQQNQQVGDVHAVIGRHSLLGSFKRHVESQLSQSGVVFVGVIDRFSTGTHGQNVKRRLEASVTGRIRGKVSVIRYNIDARGLGAMQNAIAHAKSKQIVALSVSGGLEGYGLQQLMREIGTNFLSRANRGKALGLLLKIYQKTRPDYAAVMRGLSEASYRIPVVTPIWNNGQTTAAALGANTIVTSIRGGVATDAPGLVDIYMNNVPGNNHTSISAPMFIGQSLNF